MLRVVTVVCSSQNLSEEMLCIAPKAVRNCDSRTPQAILLEEGDGTRIGQGAFVVPRIACSVDVATGTVG